MKKIFKVLVACIVASVLVALTYYLFESAVHHSLIYIWDTVFNSENTRLMVVPLCVVGGLVYFGLQQWLDPDFYKHTEHGLGVSPEPTIKNYFVVLGLGFASLLAGASLGPEAILVPASTIIGAYVGTKLFKRGDKTTQAVVAAAIMALMTAFFHSVLIGLLSVLLVVKQAKTKLSPQLLIVAAVSTVSSFLVLNTIDPANRYLNLPDFTWRLALIDLLASLILVPAGYMATFSLKYCSQAVDRNRGRVKLNSWWQQGLAAGVGLAVLYLLGGPLVQFTGNQSIAPLIQQASSLGLTGLLVVLVVKIGVISWSKTMGYRGGLIFPMVFVAATLVAIVQLLFKEVNFGIGLIAALGGILVAEKKAQILL